MNKDDDIDGVCEAIEHTNIARSTTPDSFVRAVKKHPLGTPNFHEAVRSEDTVDLKSQYPFGHRLMTKQGWSDRSGLGPDGSGIQRPIDADILAHKTSYVVHANSISTERIGKQTDAFVGKARAWNQYVLDPDTGDKSAKEGYSYDEAIDTTRRIRGSHGITASTNANSKTIIQDHYVINDNWRDATKHGCSQHIQDNVPREVSEKNANAHPENGDVFVPYRGTSEG
jgi:hypothetical protein